MKLTFKLLKKEKQRIYITVLLLLWACIIFFKAGGQSLLIHYLWPFIVGGTLIYFFQKHWLKEKASPLYVIGLLTLGIFFTTFLFDLSPSDGSLELMNIGGGILLAMVLHNVKWEDKSLKYLFGGFILVVCVLDVIGISIYSLGHPFNRLFGTLIKPDEAFSGFPNLAANLNLLALIPAFYFFNNAKHKSRMLSLGVILANILIVTSLLLTFSRGAWYTAIFILICALVYLTVKFKKNIKIILRYIVTSAIILFIGILLFLGFNTLRGLNESTLNAADKLSFQSEDEGSSVSERTASIERSIQMAIDHPLTGVGSGSFNYISQSYEKDFSTLSSYPYSLPFKLLAENGIFFVIALFAWLGIIIVKVFRKPTEYGLLGAVTLIALLMHHSIDNNFDFFAASLPVFILIGIIWPGCNCSYKPSKSWILFIISFITIAGILFVAHEAYYGTFYIKGRNAAGALNHEAGLTEYKKSFDMFYPRDARLAAANSAFALYKSFTQPEMLIEAQNLAFDYYNFDNPIDKGGPLLLAEINYVQNNYPKCLEYVDIATKVGGQNDFKTDYFRLICSKNLFENSLISKLEIYYELLKLNAHMTVLTDNPKYAVKILQIISRKYPEYMELANNMRSLAISETMKFHKKYGIDAEIEL